MKDRIRKIRKASGLTQAEFGARIGIKGNTIGNYEIGLRTPSDAVIFSICREFNVNEDWLRTGEGDPYKELPESTELGTYIGQILTTEDEFIKKAIINYMQLDEKSKKIVRDFIRSLGANDKN